MISYRQKTRKEAVMKKLLSIIIAVSTVLEGIRKEFPDALVRYAAGSQMIVRDANTIFGF